MREKRLENSRANPCLLIRNHEGSQLYIAIYVDDGSMLSSSQNEIDRFLGELRGEFKIIIGCLKSFVGLQMSRLADGISLHQKIIAKILEQFKVTDSNAERQSLSWLMLLKRARVGSGD